MVIIDDFMKLDIWIGIIFYVEFFVEVKVLVIKLEIDFGEEIGIKKLSV